MSLSGAGVAFIAVDIDTSRPTAHSPRARDRFHWSSFTLRAWSSRVGRLYAVGGYNNGVQLRSCEYISMSSTGAITGSWTAGPNMLAQRATLGVVAYGGSLSRAATRSPRSVSFTCSSWSWSCVCVLG